MKMVNFNKVLLLLEWCNTLNGGLLIVKHKYFNNDLNFYSNRYFLCYYIKFLR